MGFSQKQIGLIAACCATLILGGCKTTKQEPAGPMITPLVDIQGPQDPLTTASVEPKSAQQEPAENQAGATKQGDTFSLSFPKGKYAITKEQNNELGEFAKEGQSRRKAFHVIAYAEPQPPGTNSQKYAKTLLQAKRRGQAVTMFLRVHGVSAEKMTVRTDDAAAIKDREVRVVLK